VFTGIVQGTGRVVQVRSTPAGVRLVIDPQGWDHRPQVGESISIDGCCLTLAAPPGKDDLLAFDVVAETLSKTTLGSRAPGSRVNLERSLRATDLMGGHVVQGHVDGVGAVERVQSGADRRVWIRPPAPLMDFMVPKGSVSVEGVSLTLAGVEPAAGLFHVALIPTTLERTTLGDLKPGDRVNLEADVLAKTIVYWLRNHQGSPPPG
jgi:riboflavin synthase